LVSAINPCSPEYGKIAILFGERSLNPVRTPTTITYRNDRYGFTLRLPGWWRSYCVVGKTRTDRDTEYELHFTFKYKGKVYGDIFTILVYRMSRKEWVDHGYEESPLVFLAEYAGCIFAYITPGELPYEFINKKTGDYDYKRFGTPIRLLKRMVNQDVPRIVPTLRFPRVATTFRSVPYRASKVWPCKCKGRK
jgi:hypothetical protein